MSKNRKEKLIEEIENELNLIHNELINTPPDMSIQEYRDRIEMANKLKLTLQLLKNM